MTLAEAKKYEREYNAETLTEDVAKNIINNYQSAMNNYAEGSAEYNEAKKSYDSWMKGAKLYYGNEFDPSTGGVDTSYIEDAYKNTITSIDNNLKRTEEDIAKQRENAVKQAYSDYDRSLSTYGRNAEQLAQAGLGKSGYSDYLTGVAYGNMVGGIETANVVADEAVRNAYANADQLKLNAAQTRDEEIAKAKKAYSDNVTALLSNVGTMDKATALEIAGNLGISTDDKNRIERAYSDYANKAQGQATANILAQVGTVGMEVAVAQAKAIGLGEDAISLIENAYGDYEKREAKATYDAFISNGGYLIDEYGNQYVPTEEQIAELALKAGLEDEDVEKATSEANEKLINTYKSSITSDVTDDEIESWGLNAEVTKELKSIRDNAKYTEMFDTTLAEIKNGATTGNIQGADMLISDGNKGNVDKGQELYFENDLRLIQSLGEDGLTMDEVKGIIEKHNRDGRLSDADYGNLLTYLEAKTKGGVVDADKTRNRWLDNFIRDMGAAYAYSQSYIVPSTSTDTGVAVRIDGERYKVSTYETAENAKKSKQLDAVAGTTGNIVKEGDTYYIKSNGEWRKVNDEASNAKFYAAMDIKVSQNSFVTPPKHTVSTTTP